MKKLVILLINLLSTISMAGVAIHADCEVKNMKSCRNGGHAVWADCGGSNKGWVSYYWVDNGAIQKGKATWGTEDGSCNGPCIYHHEDSENCTLNNHNMSFKFGAWVNSYMFTKDFSEQVNCPSVEQSTSSSGSAVSGP